MYQGDIEKTISFYYVNIIMGIICYTVENDVDNSGCYGNCLQCVQKWLKSEECGVYYVNVITNVIFL